MRYPKAILLLLTAALVLTACSRGGDDLEGTEWELATIGGSAAVAGVSATIVFDENDVAHGSGSCNRFVGGWESGRGDSLTITTGPMTMIACPDPAGAQETAFVNALNRTSSYRLSGDTLTLRNASGNDLATLTKLVPSALVDTNWVLTYYNDGEGTVQGIADGTMITANFLADGTLNGSAGCNNYQTTFETTDDTMSIEPAASTRMACDQAIMDQEAAFLLALEHVEVYQLGAGTLALRTADGQMLAYFEIGN